MNLVGQSGNSQAASVAKLFHSGKDCEHFLWITVSIMPIEGWLQELRDTRIQVFSTSHTHEPNILN